MKVVSHGRKMNMLGEPHDCIHDVVQMSGLGDLVHVSYQNLD